MDSPGSKNKSVFMCQFVVEGCSLSRIRLLDLGDMAIAEIQRDSKI